MKRSEILNVLVRKGPYPPGPLAIYAALYQSDHGGVPLRELVDRVRWGDEASFRKVLQGISRRVGSRTPRVVGGYRALLAERFERGTTYIALRPEARDAINASPELDTFLRTPVVDILATRNPANPQGDKSRWLRLTLRR